MTNEITVHNAENNGAAVMGGGNLFSSFKAETREERLAVFKAVSETEALDDHIGETIMVRDMIIQPVELKDDNGEVRIASRIIIIDDQGTAYGCVSSGVETSVRNLFVTVGEPTYEPPLPLRAVKKAGRHGFKFTSLEYAG